MAVNSELTSGVTTSVWIDESGERGEPLRESVAAEVCVVGAGISGLSVAYELSLAGKKVVVLDDGEIGSGETFRTTAHLVNALDDRFYELERFHGREGAKLAAQSHTRAVDRIEEIVRSESIDCDFLRLNGYLFVPPGGDAGEIDRELEATHRAGLRQVHKVERAPIAVFDTGAALCFPRQAQFHIGKYLQGLAAAIEKNGGKIYNATHAAEIRGGSPVKVMTSGGQTVTSGAVAVCTNTPVNDRVAVHTKQMPYRTYVVAARVPAGAVEIGLYWDTADPYHYVRLMKARTAGEDLLIIGGEDHKAGQDEGIPATERFAKLEKWARERWPKMTEIEYRWSGQVMEPDDGLAFIGRNPLDEKNVYIATGDSGNGMTHGVIAGILISDLILGRKNPWERLYEPKRIKLRATGEWLKENLNTFAQYGDYVTTGDVSSPLELKPGEGAIIREGIRKIACYRDEDGIVHRNSAVCPHLGAIVQWNGAEKTWDCPAHGSRFTGIGAVINGPANIDLSRFEEEKAA